MKLSILHHLKFQLMLIAILIAVWVWIFSPGIQVQWIFLIVMLLITGIPHGSLDFYIEQSQAAVTGTSFSSVRFMVRYLVNMLLYGICWYCFPFIAFLIFILLTAYHFGEIDWPFHHAGRLNTIIFFSVGLFFIVFAVAAHAQETAPVLAVITGKVIQEKDWLLYGPMLMRYAGAGLLLFVCWVPLYLYRQGYPILQIVAWSLQTIAWCIFIYAMPIFVGFAFYFGAWHSVLSFNLIRQQLSLPPDFSGWKRLIIKALPFSLLAFAGIGLLVFLHFSIAHLDNGIAYIFMGIAILTLPHLQVFTRLVQFVAGSASEVK